MPLPTNRWLWLNKSQYVTAVQQMRYNWLCEVIIEGSKSMLNKDLNLFTSVDIKTLKYYVSEPFAHYLKMLPHRTPHYNKVVANILYSFLRICRKLSIEDQVIVGENLEDCIYDLR